MTTIELSGKKKALFVQIKHGDVSISRLSDYDIQRHVIETELDIRVPLLLSNPIKIIKSGVLESGDFENLSEI